MNILDRLQNEHEKICEIAGTLTSAHAIVSAKRRIESMRVEFEKTHCDKINNEAFFLYKALKRVEDLGVRAGDPDAEIPF